MPIQTQCEHCGFAYLSKDEMAGKKVRCRNCGQIFTISGSEAPLLPDTQLPDVPPEETPSAFERNSDTTKAMPAITMTESNMSGGVGSAKSRIERAGDPGTFDVGGEAAAAAMRPSVPFNFPFAGDLDTWLPRVVSGLMVFWALYLLWGWRPDVDEVTTYPAWAGLIPAGAALVLFLALWIPLFAGAMRKISSALRFSLPSRGAIRATCLASIPFALGVAFWIAGESTVTLSIGVFLGTAVAVPAAWFLYRLTERDLPYCAIGLFISALVATVVSVFLYVGANYITNQAMLSFPSASFVASPLGPGLNWAVPAPPTKPVVTTPKTRGSATQSTVATLKPSADAPLSTPLMVPVDATVADVVHPLTGGNYMAIIGPIQPDDPQESQEIVRYSIDPLQRLDTVVFAKSNQQAGYALSPNGDLLARVTTFRGTMMIQFWSFSQKRVVNTVDTGNVPPRLVGFIGDTTLLCEWIGKGISLATADVNDRNLNLWASSPDQHGSILAVVPSQGMVAVTAKTTAMPVDLRIYRRGREPQQIPLAEKTLPVEPNGIAASPDGARLALAYQDAGQLQLIVHNLSDGAQVANHLFPGGLGLSASGQSAEGRRVENRLTWIPDSSLVLYDHLLIDAITGKFVGEVGVKPVVRAALIDADTLHVLVAGKPPQLFQANVQPKPATRPAETAR